MSVLVDKSTKLIVQGMTGREGSFHSLIMMEYGTNIVAGVTPGKGGQELHSVPIYNSVCDAIKETNANTSILFVPPKFTKEAILEAIDAGLKLVVTVADGVPFHDMLFCGDYAKKNDCVLIGPNTSGLISPKKCKVGFMPHALYKEGGIGVMSRSGTLSYETANNLTKAGLGQSTVIGVGGDMIPGSTFIDLLPLYEEDPETEAVVIIGEIGGNDEEMAAEYAENNLTKPIIAFIVGNTAPAGKTMGHAGAIVSESGEGNAEDKKEALKEAGVCVAEKITDVPDLVKKALGR